MIGPHHSIICSLTGTGQGAAPWIADLQRRDVVSAAHLVGQFEHPREHRRHELGVRHAMALDERQELLGIEVLHDDRGAAHADRQTDPDQRCRMVERRGREIDHARRGNATASTKKSKIGNACAGGLSGKGRKIPLGRPVVPEE